MPNKIEGEEAMEMFKLVKASGMLPARIEELLPMQFIGTKALKYARDILNDPNVTLYMTEAQRKTALRDGQDAGDWLLSVEAKIGEQIINQPTHQIEKATNKTPPPHTKRPDGVTQNMSKIARTIFRNPEIVEKVKAQARENEDIPTKTAVIAEVRYQNEKKRRVQAEVTKKKNRTIIAVEQLQYISALDKCIHYLPQKPPKDWDNNALKEATAKAKIIIKRLEVFNG